MSLTFVSATWTFDLTNSDFVLPSYTAGDLVVIAMSAGSNISPFDPSWAAGARATFDAYRAHIFARITDGTEHDLVVGIEIEGTSQLIYAAVYTPDDGTAIWSIDMQAVFPYDTAVVGTDVTLSEDDSVIDGGTAVSHINFGSFFLANDFGPITSYSDSGFERDAHNATGPSNDYQMVLFDTLNLVLPQGVIDASSSFTFPGAFTGGQAAHTMGVRVLTGISTPPPPPPPPPPAPGTPTVDGYWGILADGTQGDAP